MTNRYAEFRTGWPALLAATVGSGVGVTALLFYSLGSFTGALQDEFGWSRTAVSSSFLYTTVVLTVATVPLGWLLDRIGPRPIAFVSVPGLTLSLLLLSRFQGELLHFHLLFALAGLLGAGTTSVIYTKVINSSFFTSRGLALGISLSGLGLAALGLPLLVNTVVQQWGWRAGFLALAALSLTVLPFAFFGLRSTAPATVHPATLNGATRSAALKSRPFWTLLVGFVLVGGSIPAVIPHMVPMLTDAGVSATAAASIAGLIGLGVIAGRLCVGFLVDRFFAPLVAAPLFLTTAAGCLLLMWSGPALAPVAAIMIGISFGAEADLIAFFCGHYFGLKSYGFIYGLIYSVFSLAVSIGPIWAGAFYDHSGNYRGALVTVAVMLAAGAATLLTLPRRRPLVDDNDDHRSQSDPTYVTT
ncbi:MFS transporter [Rhodococcus olei]|uniref:MFS transporter n=2 Tax=Rhodococcus olei TaxID=2161675 RepID=A0ABP8PCD0_9NOCA